MMTTNRYGHASLGPVVDLGLAGPEAVWPAVSTGVSGYWQEKYIYDPCFFWGRRSSMLTLFGGRFVDVYNKSFSGGCPLKP